LAVAVLGVFQTGLVLTAPTRFLQPSRLLAVVSVLEETEPTRVTVVQVVAVDTREHSPQSVRLGRVLAVPVTVTLRVLVVAVLVLLVGKPQTVARVFPVRLPVLLLDALAVVAVVTIAVVLILFLTVVVLVGLEQARLAVLEL
tara:strand:- start:512 stop:940 length:429 start_codon:yes stop_codon:yes gene_type:complete